MNWPKLKSCDGVGKDNQNLHRWFIKNNWILLISNDFVVELRIDQIKISKFSQEKIACSHVLSWKIKLLIKLF